MDSAYAPTLTATRWRTATIVACALAAIETAVLGVIGVGMLGKSVAHRVREAAAAEVVGAPVIKKEPPAGQPKLMREETKVLVLNGSGVNGAAGTAAEKLRVRNYRIADVTNAREQKSTTRTMVMYRKGYRAEGVRLARDARTPIVTPLDGMRPRALHGAQVVLLVGS